MFHHKRSTRTLPDVGRYPHDRFVQSRTNWLMCSGTAVVSPAVPSGVLHRAGAQWRAALRLACQQKHFLGNARACWLADASSLPSAPGIARKNELECPYHSSFVGLSHRPTLRGQGANDGKTSLEQLHGPTHFVYFARSGKRT